MAPGSVDAKYQKSPKRSLATASPQPTIAKLGCDGQAIEAPSLPTGPDQRLDSLSVQGPASIPLATTINSQKTINS
jgi:hypothetical protein